MAFLVSERSVVKSDLPDQPASQTPTTNDSGGDYDFERVPRVEWIIRKNCNHFGLL
jgi:hypothetical protein